MGAPELILSCSRRSDCGDGTKRSCEQEKQWRRVVGSESECCLLSPWPCLPPNLLPLADFTLHYLIACKPLLVFHHPNLSLITIHTQLQKYCKKKLVIFLFLFQPQTVDEVRVDPVQDDIEIVNEGEGTDAFAVSTQSFYILHT